MAVDVSRIPNNNKFDPVREAILQLQTEIEDTGATIGNGTLTISTSSPLTGSGTFTANQTGPTSISIGIDGAEYLTNITHDTVNQKLVVTYGDGTTADLSLAQYIDDTNLARLVSGSLDSQTGIATFTRDDATTFTVDLSALFDDTDTNDFLTSASFDDSNGIITFGVTNQTSVTVDIDGRYPLVGDLTAVSDNIITSADFSATSNRFKLTLTQEDAGTIEASFDDVVLSESMAADYIPYVKVGGGDGDTTNAVLNDSFLKINGSTLELDWDTGNPLTVAEHDLKMRKDGGGSGTYYQATYAADSVSFLHYASSLDIDTAKIGATTTGRIRINDTYSLPVGDGTAGQVLTTDGSGDLSWADASGGGSLTLDDVTTNNNSTTNSITIGALNVTGGVSVDANGVGNTVHVWDDSTSGQPGFIVTNTGNQSTSTHTLYLKNYNSAVNATVFGQSIASKSIVASSDGGEGLLFGTISNKPIYIGTNNTLALTIDTSQDATFQGDVTAPTATIGGILLQDSADRAGLLEVNQKGTSSWSGIQINHGSNHWSFMGNANDVGVFDDHNGEWVWLYSTNNELGLYYNGAEQARTQNGYFLATNEFRSAVFRGTNTAYHVTPAGTSNLSALNLEELVIDNVTWNSNKVRIEGASPNIEFRGTDAGDIYWQLGSNGDNFYILDDANKDGTFDGSPYPFQLDNANTQLQVFGNRVLTTADEGSGNGLDADTLDGVHKPTNFSATSQSYTTIASGGWALPTGSSVFSKADSVGGVGDDGYWYVLGRRDVGGGYSGIYSPHSNGTAWLGMSLTNSANPTWYKLWTSGNDGSGSGLDADTVDGLQASQFLRSDTSDTMSGTLTVTGDLNVNGSSGGVLVDSAGHASLRIDRGSTSYDNNLLFYTAGDLRWRLWQDGSSDYLHIRDEANSNNLVNFSANTVQVNGDLYGKSVNGQYSRLFRFGGIYFTWDSDSYGTNFNHSITSTDNGVWGDDITINSYGHVRINIDSNGNGNNTFSIGRHSTGTGNTMLTLNESSELTVNGNVQSPIFYDSDNTGYYVDPANSNLSVKVYGEISNSNAYEGNLQPGALNIGRTDTNYAGIQTWASDVRFGILANCSNDWEFGIHDSGTSVESVFVYNNSNGSITMGRDVGWGTTPIIAANSFRAPIFYDSDNTSYYVNPASGSLLSYGRIANASGGASLILGTQDTSRVFSDNARNSLVINASYYPHLYINATVANTNTNHGAVISMTGNISGGGHRRWSMGIANLNPSMFTIGTYDNSDNPHYGCGGDVLGEATWGSKLWLDSSSNLQTNGSMRSPIFYDSDNTGYYINPASSGTSINVRGVIQNPSIWINDGDNYGGYSENIRLFNPINNGPSVIAFSASGTSGTPVSSILGYSDRLEQRFGSNWQERVRNGYVEASGSYRAPIFYDSNNTAGYADLASDNKSLAINGGIKFANTNAQSRSGFIGRHGSGGSLGTDAYPSPLYSIGDSYRPSGTGLSNHYGVGYAHTNASFYSLSGQSGWGFYVSSDGDARVQLSGSNGTISCTGDVVAYASDGRLKENVQPIENALDKVMKIRGVSYDWVENITEEYDFHPTKMHEVGVIAQEVQAVLPEVVTIAPFDSLYSQKTGWKKVQKQMESELGREVTKAEAKTEYEKLPIEEQEAMQEKHDFLTVNYERLTALLIEAVKEQQKQIDELKSLINKS